MVSLLAAAQDLEGGTGQYGAVDAADGPVPGSRPDDGGSDTSAAVSASEPHDGW